MSRSGSAIVFVGFILSILTTPMFVAAQETSAPFVFRGEVPEVVNNLLRDEIAPLYRRLEMLAGTSLEDGETIEIYFVPFEDGADRYPLLMRLQEEWLHKFPEARGGVFSKNLGFHYDGTNVIQLSPKIFADYFTNDPQGRKTIPVGMGMYTLAHEVLHVLFEHKGVPGVLHHCLFVRDSVTAALADYLAERRIANVFVLRYRLVRSEIIACEMDKKRFPETRTLFGGRRLKRGSW